MKLHLILGLVFVAAVGTVRAEPPSVSYIFPPGGQRGTTVDVHVGGHFLHGQCPFEMLGPGVDADSPITETATTWFEGPIIPMPASQAAEDYPKDHAGRIRIAPDAPLGVRYWQVWTSQGATSAMKFVTGDLPEVVEQEIDGDAIPVAVELPVTINGRIFPREDVDIWTVEARAGQTVHAEVCAARLGSPLDSQLVVLDDQGRRVAENSDACGADSCLSFTAPADGLYQVHICDTSFGGLQHYVYRLTLTTGPRVDATYPLGGRRGGAVRLELSGTGLAQHVAEVALPSDAPRDLVHRLSQDGLQSNSFLLELDDLDEHLEAEPNDEPAPSAAYSVPAIFNGRIGAAGDVDCWCFSAAAGEILELDLRAARLGSPLDSILVLLDADGKELARSDDVADGQTDSRLEFTAPAAGVYRVRIEERFASRGGPRFAYRLRIAHPPAPDFRLLLAADALSLVRAGEVKLKVDAERIGGFGEAIALAVDGLPQGVTAENLAIAAGAASTEITFKADATAKIAASRLAIRGAATIAGQETTRMAVRPALRGEAALDSVLLAVALPTPFKVVGEFLSRYAPRGTVYHRDFKIDRGGFDGPLTIKLADRQFRHLQGVTGPEIVVPPGQDDFDYPLSLPPWLEVERTSRTVVVALGELVDEDGSRHTVSYSSGAQNDQIIILGAPGPLSVRTGATSLAAVPGATVDLPVYISRSAAVTGPAQVRLALPQHMQGIEADPITIPADQERGALTIRFGATCGPFNMPIAIQALATYQDHPAVAECNLSMVAITDTGLAVSSKE